MNQMSLLDDAPTFPVPAARRSDPETSKLAAELALPRAVGDRLLVAYLLDRHGAQTDFELADRAGRAPTSLGKRRGELMRAGLVEPSGETRLSWYGAKANVWRITPAGRVWLASAAGPVDVPTRGRL